MTSGSRTATGWSSITGLVASTSGNGWPSMVRTVAAMLVCITALFSVSHQ